MDAIRADILALKSIVIMLIDDLDEESRKSLADAASEVVRNRSEAPDEIKREAIERVTNLLDLGP
jgi:uncharacterized tellurite resistance protein B-like protein